MALAPLVPVLKNTKKIIIENWQTLSEDKLSELIKNNNSGNIGVRLDNYAVIDPDEPAAEIFLNSWEKKGILPPTVAWKTARGFTKRLYRRPSEWPFDGHTANVDTMKMQLRSGSGVQDVIPPSTIDGNAYVWLPGHDPDTLSPSELPDDVIRFFLDHSLSKPHIPAPNVGVVQQDRLDIQAYLANYGIELTKIKPYKDGQLFCLKHCIFNPDHKPNEAAIFQAADGKLSYQCFHDTCQGRTWAEARLLISGHDKLTIGTEVALLDIHNSRVKNKLDIKAIPPLLGGGIARPSSRENTPVNKPMDKLELIKSLRENTLTSVQKTYLVKLIEQSSSEKSISERVYDYIIGTSWDVNRTEWVRELGLWDNTGHREAAYKAITRLKDEGIITQTGRRGYYRLVDTKAEKIDFLKVDPENYWKIEWPFRLHQLIKLFPQNLVLLSGATNAGKTSFLLEFCRLNAGKKGIKIRYISTEMNDQELRERLDYYDKDTGGFSKPLAEWESQVDFRMKFNNIIDIIQPNWINIVDYYSTEGNFYDIDKEFKEINQKLKKGIAIIAIQKKRGADMGVGGAFTEFLPRLVLNFDANKIIIRKAKNLMPGILRGADGFVIKYKLAQGYKWTLNQNIEELFWWWNYRDKEHDLSYF